ncbi:SipW-cognate class signal peptide [Acetitomaculum ruminis DSM 5522]|uniref:SipW-cognate class signal peptide n=1 Tax=Acetitomaculum ruminis DSM 5522 TaxID=1120918 RepID=A0A1I0XQK1_9FIRM|nr:hypothetical protein [Acetitomaculum ruminis]SFB02957.1 SipW-cognate class signal peptide [Acetitomaculum ruminis DSM 5522]
MKKRKLIKLLGAMVIIATIGVGVTLAYLSDKTGTLNNTFAMGDTQIKLKESAVEYYEWGFRDADGDENWTVDFSRGSDGFIKNGVKYEGLVAGDHIYKDPTVIFESEVFSANYVYLGNCRVANEENKTIETVQKESTDKSLVFTLEDNWEIYEANANGGIIIRDTEFYNKYSQGVWSTLNIFKVFTEGDIKYTTKIPNDFKRGSTFQDLKVQALIMQTDFVTQADEINIIKANTDWLNN